MRIIGIDLGSTSIKAVEIDSAFGRYEVHEYHERPVEPGSEPAHALSQLILQLPKQPDRIVISMPTHELTFRNLHLPTRDRKAIQAGVGFELDDELPFDIEKAVFDYAVLAQSKQGTDVHVAATLKRNIGGFLARLAGAGVDPDIVTTEAWAYRALLNKVLPPAEQEQPVLFAQIGHERSTLYVHWRGSPVLCREIAWGGADLTVAICQRYQIPMDQAEQTKRDHGFVIAPDQTANATREQIEFSNTLLAPLQTLGQELRQAILTSKNITHQNVSTIYLAGGTALLPGLNRVMEDSLMTPVKPLRGLSSITSSGVTYSDQADNGFCLASGLALTLVGSDRNTVINLRKGEFSKQGRSSELNLESLKKPMLAAGAVAASMLLSLGVQSQVYGSRMKETDSQLERGIKSFFGQVSSSAIRGYMSNPSTLKSAINRELNKQREINKLFSSNPRSPLDFLKSISSAVPKDVVVDMIQYSAGAAPTASYLGTEEPTATLTFLLKDAQHQARLKTALSRFMKDLQEGKAEEVAGPDGAKRVKISYSGRLMENAYGN